MVIWAAILIQGSFNVTKALRPMGVMFRRLFFGLNLSSSDKTSKSPSAVMA